MSRGSRFCCSDNVANDNRAKSSLENGVISTLNANEFQFFKLRAHKKREGMPIFCTRKRIKTETTITDSLIPESPVICSRVKVAYGHKLTIKLQFSININYNACNISGR
jgi:hypothetical protein